ncbi:MAG: substrate-binding domain-containing protein [Candidatus Glassbacteria bacterium]
MIELNINHADPLPLFEQIAKQVRQLIATKKLKPGDHLPTVRQLASYLSISPQTVLSAYQKLGRENVIVSLGAGGTIVRASPDDPHLRIVRQRHLSDLVSGSILEVLSQGYSPEELEATFSLHLTRWREEQAVMTTALGHTGGESGASGTIRIVGSHDVALNLLISQLRKRHPTIAIEMRYAGSLGGLIALQEDRADLAGIHLLDEETGEYNYPYVKHILPGREVVIVHLAHRIQGLMFNKGNPLHIRGLEDLRRPGVRIVNRQKGSGTRILLDFKLRQLGIMPKEVKGYERELDTHLAVASCIAQGEADAGLGIQAAAQSCDIGFLPLFKEQYDLVIPMAQFTGERLSPLLRMIESESFRDLVDRTGGYDTTDTGTKRYCRYDK